MDLVPYRGGESSLEGPIAHFSSFGLGAPGPAMDTTNLLPSVEFENKLGLWSGSTLLSGVYTWEPAPETASVAYVTQPVTSLRGTQEQNWQTVVPREKSLEERLFEALAEVKVLTSKIAMHLDRSWRDQLFAQLDNMHSPSEWDEDDELLKAGSFETFLKTWFIIKPERSPGFGISVRGNLLASWSIEGWNLTLEFFPNRGVSWLVSLPSIGIRERACGHTALETLLSRLSPYEPERWFVNDQGAEYRG